MSEPLFDFAARFVLGMETAERANDVAAEMLAAGVDSPALRTLAVLEEPRAEELMPTLEHALRDIGKFLPGPREAALWLARGEARRMLAGEGSAYEVSRAIWSIARHVHGQAIASLDPFIYAASEWEERPADRPFLEKEMLKAAEDLLSADPPNTPGDAEEPSHPR